MPVDFTCRGFDSLLRPAGERCRTMCKMLMSQASLAMQAVTCCPHPTAMATSCSAACIMPTLRQLRLAAKQSAAVTNAVTMLAISELCARLLE